MLQACAEQDKIVTDCLGLLQAAGKGLAASTTAKMSLARAWNIIAHLLDGNLGTLGQARKLTWMPAHQSAKAIGCAMKSTGTPITALDWRANHLVDGLAKRAAAVGATTEEETKLIASAERLVKHCAGQLAAATYRANNCVEAFVGKDGMTRSRCIRDSQEIPKAKKKTGNLKPLAALEPPPARPEEPAVESSSGESSAEATKSRRSLKRAAKAESSKRTRLVQESALNDILHKKRLNHREATIEAHRRKLAAVQLVRADEPPARSEWSVFFDLVEGNLAEEPCSIDMTACHPPEERLGEESGDDNAPATSHLEAALENPPPERCTTRGKLLQASFSVRSGVGGPVQRATRTRPTRGSNASTAANSKAAVDSLLGRITLDHG